MLAKAIKSAFFIPIIPTMSKNNLIRKSDKKFIRHEKARIRRQFFDGAKQQEMIDALYKRFTAQPGAAPVAAQKAVTRAKAVKAPKAAKAKKATVKAT